jgi:hypothetical protein
MDLVELREWEDHTDFLTLEQAGLKDYNVFDTVPSAQREYYQEENGL